MLQISQHLIGSKIFLLVQSDAKDHGYGEDWTFTHSLDISQDLFTQIAREHPFDTWCRLMAVVAGKWTMLYDCHDDPPEGRSPAQHAREQLADFDATLPGLRDVPGGLRLDLLHDPPSEASSDALPPSEAPSSSDDDATQPSPPHATLTHNLAALLSLQ
jgi:hypothetical protein